MLDTAGFQRNAQFPGNPYHEAVMKAASVLESHGMDDPAGTAMRYKPMAGDSQETIDKKLGRLHQILNLGHKEGAEPPKGARDMVAAALRGFSTGIAPAAGNAAINVPAPTKRQKAMDLVDVIGKLKTLPKDSPDRPRLEALRKQMLSAE